MADTYTHNGVTVRLNKKGADRYTKISYPLRFGRYTEVETEQAIFHFRPGGEIAFARGKGGNWPDPQEWLKRTAGNDWVYYSTGGYTGVFEAIGEYYLPNMQYPTNSLIGGNPFANEHVRRIINGWYEHIQSARRDLGEVPEEIDEFFAKVETNSPAALAEKARRLFQISGGRVSVLPPDARHVDYDVIPLTVSTGCLYKCRFCKVKNTNRFRETELDGIEWQIEELVELYGESIRNYNSIFLGEHDALHCSRNHLIRSASKAYEDFRLSRAYIRGANLFLFGSVDSFLAAEEQFFQDLRSLPFAVYINIGFESVDQQTLEQLGKPISAVQVEEAFLRMQDINERFMNIEVTGNFLMDKELPDGHYPRLLGLIRDRLDRKKPKGSIYLSPLKFGAPSRELVFDFNRLKLQSRLPTFLYIIQRL